MDWFQAASRGEGLFWLLSGWEALVSAGFSQFRVIPFLSNYAKKLFLPVNFQLQIADNYFKNYFESGQMVNTCLNDVQINQWTDV